MVDMHVGDYQCTNMLNGEINGKVRGVGALAGVFALEKAAVYKNASGV
jgi:hypothetical protein